MVDLLRSDIRDALRGFVRNPAFLLAAVFSLALGVGANTAIFSVASALLLRPLPYPEADRLVILWNRSPGLGISEDWFSTAQYFDVKNAGSGFEQVAIAYGANENLTGDGRGPERISTLRVSSNLLPMLGARPAAGRLFTAGEDTQLPASTAILGYGTWLRRYGRDPNVIGRRLELNGRGYQIVGVLPESFSLPHEVMPTLGNAAGADIVIPLALGPAAARTRNREDYNIIARLKPGIAVAQVQQEMDALTARLRGEFPDFYPPNGGLTFGVVPLQEQVVGGVRRPVALLGAAVGCVLLIACANVANLLLSRGVSRQREIAVRAALGADRRRIVRQLLTESVLLAVAGGALGLLLAHWGLQWMQLLGARSIPRLREIRIDSGVLLFTLTVSLLSALLFGLVPALRAARLDLQTELKDGQGAAAGFASFTRGGPRQRTRKALVVAELMLSVMLLVAAGLLIRSFVRLQDVAPGFNPQGVLTLEVTLMPPRYADTAKVAEAYRDLWTRLARVPGVISAGGVSSLPLSNMMAWGPITIEGRAVSAGERFINVDQRVAAADYFKTMEIPLKQGRLFTAEDTRETPRVAVIDERMAQALWPAGDALGKRFRTGGIDAAPDVPWITVVGVVGSIKQDALDADSRMAVYFPQMQLTPRGITIVARTAGDPSAAAPAVRRELHDMDPNLPVYNVKTMMTRVDESLARRRFSMLLLTIFAALAAGLAAVGIYGVIAFLVAQGAREVGIRMALGATPRGIGMLVLRHGLVIAAIGLGLGVAGAFVVTRLMRSLLFGVGAADPATYVAVSIFVAATALAASYLPARRAARLDPMRSLR
ncbi:MAG TPA: ABC transporter permease [Vicinamibacterales bacterium]|nr:ABC transporter permease [Vicinamibacterales bacterium]